jgi:polyketide synthase PksN
MELPGRQALFAKASLSFSAEPRRGEPVKLTVAAFDERFGMVDVAFDDGCATGTLRAFVRPPPVALDVDALEQSSALKGQSALVVGGSRGLGAAIAAAFARAGCAVVATHASERPEGEALARAGVKLARADARDGEAMGRVVSDLPALDLLVLSASPAILEAPFERDSAAPTVAFVSESLRMAAVPLAAAVGRVRTLVVMSSAYVSAPPDKLPHYVAAKFALEGLARALAAASPELRVLLVRPPRTLTDQTNSVRGREELLSAEQVATAIVRRIAAAKPGVELIEAFA